MATKAGVLESDPTIFAEFAANVYTRWVLDALVEIAYAISVDFVNRPQLYQGPDIPDFIVDLRMSYGNLKSVPNTLQRQALMMPIFGRSDGLKPDATNGSSSFQMARKKLIDACIAFSERAVDTGIPMLKDRVRSALIPLRSHLDGIQGRSFDLGGKQIFEIFSAVNVILIAPAVTQVFGIPQINAGWPFLSNDPNGAKLVEAAGIALGMPADYKLSFTRFILLQRVAVEGGTALTLVLTTDPTSDTQLEALITQCYTWGTSLRDYQQAS